MVHLMSSLPLALGHAGTILPTSTFPHFCGQPVGYISTFNVLFALGLGVGQYGSNGFSRTFSQPHQPHRSDISVVSRCKKYFQNWKGLKNWILNMCHTPQKEKFFWGGIWWIVRKNGSKYGFFQVSFDKEAPFGRLYKFNWPLLQIQSI